MSESLPNPKDPDRRAFFTTALAAAAMAGAPKMARAAIDETAEPLPEAEWIPVTEKEIFRVLKDSLTRLNIVYETDFYTYEGAVSIYQDIEGTERRREDTNKLPSVGEYVFINICHGNDTAAYTEIIIEIDADMVAKGINADALFYFIENRLDQDGAFGPAD